MKRRSQRFGYQRIAEQLALAFGIEIDKDTVRRSESVPQSLSSDHDPLFLFHRWRANLRILQIREIKSVPYVPLSHPFVELLIGTIRRDFLDQVPRAHRALGGNPPVPSAKGIANIHSVTWQSHCRRLYQLPSAA